VSLLISSSANGVLLQKGLKYNIHAKKENWIQTIALEAETAVTQLPPNDRDVYRKLIAERIDKLRKQNPAQYEDKRPTRCTVIGT